jgi:predicted permease
MLFLASVTLLLIAAINVGCLLLARVLDRRRELAIRAALGADSRRLVVQLFVEALLLVGAGGALGALAGPPLLDALLRLSPVTLPHYVEIRPDPLTFVIAFVTLAFAGVLAGTVPAVVGRSAQPGEVLRDGGRGTLGRTTERRWTRILIAGETALTLILLVAGGLLLRSFDRLNGADLGFDRTRIARFAITLNSSDVGPVESLPAFYERLHAGIAEQPGVERVGLVSPTLPPWDGERGRVLIQGSELDAGANGLDVGVHFVDHGLLPMLGGRIVAGRNVEAADDATRAPIVVVSESLSRLVGGPERALGRGLRFVPGGTRSIDREFRIVGVADDLAYDGVVEQDTRRYLGLGDHADARRSRYDVYLSLAQTPSMMVSIGVSTNGDPAALIAPIRQTVGRMLPGSAVHWVSTMDDEIAIEYAPSRFYSIIVAMFSLAALLLTTVGLFALMSHTASQRLSEMGLRVALGASRGSSAALLLRSGLIPLGTGVVVGLAGAALVSRSMQTMLYDVAAFDGVTFVVAVGCLLASCLAAALIPARRVARVDPITILRGD